MNQRESLNIQNQSIEGAVTCVMSYLKATQREKKGRERRNQIEKEETKMKKQVCESRNMNLRKKRAQGKIAKWSKTIDYMCDMEIVRVWQKHMEQGEQIRKMEKPRKSEIN